MNFWVHCLGVGVIFHDPCESGARGGGVWGGSSGVLVVFRKTKDKHTWMSTGS